MHSSKLLLQTLSVGLLAIGFAAAGCGPKKNNPDPDAGVDAGTDGWVPGTLTVAVYDLANSDMLDVPLAGATVAMDAPFDPRVEQITGSNGETSFDVSTADWSLGTLSVTAHKQGYMIGSRVNITQAYLDETGGRVELALLDLPTASATAILAGSAEGMEDEANWLVVMPILEYGLSSEGQGPDFRLEVPAQQAFQAMAFEYHYESSTIAGDPWYLRDFPNFKLFDVAAIPDGTELVTIDFSAGTLDGTEVEGTAALPTDPSSSLRNNTRLWAYVIDRNTSRPFGWSTYADLQDADTFEYSIQYYDVGLTGPVETSYMISNSTHSSIVTREGLPQPGLLPDTFVEFPVWVSPPNTMGSRSLYEPIEWENRNEGMEASYALLLGDVFVWYVLAGVDSTTLKVPEAPSSVNRDELLPGYLRGSIRVGVTPDRSAYLSKFASTPPIRLIP
ncbi:MAG: hypothetical protein RBU30_26860 [Polyangia bacterium]|jgi:hypothetical protein|nr:hypothetical protein [Polyangia bacterium]